MSNKNLINLTINTKELSHALHFSGSVVEKRNVITELSNIKLLAQGDSLTLGATDMDLYLNQQIGAKIVSEGETTVSAQLLTDIVRKIPDETINLIQEENSNILKIIGSNYNFELLTLPAEQFPILEDITADIHLKLQTENLAKILEYTIFSMSNEETRYNLNGIYFHIKDGEFYGVSTDGHRLSVSSTQIDKNLKNFGVIIPKKTVIELLKILKDQKNSNFDVELFVSETKIKFVIGKIILVSKLIDGNFPEYDNFIPSENEFKLSINSKILSNAIDRVATITVDKFRAIKFHLNKDNMEITASGEAKGAAKERINYNNDDERKSCVYNGDSISIGFNPKYINDVLSALNEKNAEIYFKDSSSPVLIKANNSADDKFVIMPVKL